MTLGMGAELPVLIGLTTFANARAGVLLSLFGAVPCGVVTRCVRPVGRLQSGEGVGLEEANKLSGHGVGLLDH
jgi:hypothetical protein